MILLSFGKDNHCIAAYHSSGKLFGYGSHLYVFEPNFGEIKIGASETAVKGFFKALAETYKNYVNKAGEPDPKKLDRVTVTKLSDAFASTTRSRAA
ncbi:YopT-type cysteine protease domain-containing protein [Rhizobiaceae sp. 2RAB30]